MDREDIKRRNKTLKAMFPSDPCGACDEKDERIAELEKEPQLLTMQLAEIKDLLADRTAENALFRAENERLRQQLSDHVVTDNTGVIAEQDAEHWGRGVMTDCYDHDGNGLGCGWCKAAELEAVVSAARVIFNEYLNGRVRASPFVEDELITMGQHIKALDNIGRADEAIGELVE